MENSWQIKCGSTFPSSSTPSMAPSSMDHRDQMNTGYYSYPHAEPDLRSMVLGRMEDSVFSNSVSFSIHKTGCADLGNSFLALLSGPPSLLQCDFQEFSHPKSSSSSVKLPSNVSSFSMNAVGSDIPLISNRLLSENLSNQSLRNGADFGPVFSSRAVVNSNSGNSVLHDLQGSDLTKAVVSHIIPCNEKVKDPSLNGECHVTNPADTRKLSSGNVQSSQNVPLEVNSSSSKQPSAFMSGCPRVFCLDKSGHLLLSNTGLLGIVCSCHYFHMSVSKFCEHSGLCDVNAGDVVHMDSGETIAQWRKFYFQKSRIRVPEDQSEWDWPEGLSVTGGFVKSSVTLPNLCKSSDLSHWFGSSGGLIRSGQPLDHVLFPKNHPEQNLLIDALQNKRQRNISDVDNFLLKSSIGSSCGNLDAVVDNQIMECPVSRGLTVQKFVSSGLDNGRQSISACIDSVLKNGNSSISSTLQNVRELGKDSDVSRSINVKDNVIVGRDAASSNIELRLGQPYQPSRTLGNSILPVIGPQKFDKLLDPPNVCFRRQMIHNAANNTEEDYRQYHLCAADQSSYSTEKEPSQLNLGNHAIGSISAMNVRLEKSKINAANSSVVLPFSDFNTATEGAHSKANVDMVNGDGHMMTRALHHESHASECDQFTFCWNGGNGLERQLNISQLDSLRLMDKGKGVGRVSDVPCISKDTLFGNLKPVENSVLGGSSDPCFSAVNNKSCYSRLPFSVVPDASDSRNLSGYVEKVPCLGSSGQGDHAVLRSNFPLQGISMGLPLASSASTLDKNPAFVRQEGFGASPYLLDDNLRLLALRQIVELSKQQHALTSVINQEPGKYGSSSHIHHPLVDASISLEQRHGPNLTSKRDVSEASMNFLQSAAALRRGDDKKKVASVTGNLLHPEGTDLPYQLSDDPIQNERPSLRLGRGDKNMSRSSEHESFCQRVPYTCYQGKCNCEAPKNYSRNFDSKVGSSPSAFKEQMGTGSSEASMIFNSKYANNQVLLKDLTTSLDQNDKLSRQLHKDMVCHAFQWRDVPSKVKGVCDATVVDQSANVLDQIEHDGSQLGDTSAKCFNKVMQIVDYLKDQEKSNVSSGDSAPAVTHASIEVNNIDFSTVDAWDTGYGSNHIVDEGSGIDRCWSSDDALGSERSAEFLGSTFKANSRKEGSSHIINNQPSRSLLDELKIIDSLTWKKGRNQIHSGLAIHGKSTPQKSKTRLQMGKRKRAIKLKMLSESCSPAGPSVLPDDNPKHNITELPNCSSKNMQMLIPSGQGTSHASRACFIRPSSKHSLSCKRGAWEDDYQTELFGDTDFCKKPEVSGRKKLRTDLTSDAFRKFCMQEPIHEVAEKTEKHNSVGCTGTSSSRQVNVSSRNVRPVVIGKYGEISSRKDVSKPAKLVSLSRILKTSRRCALPKNCKPQLTSMRELKKTASTQIDLCYTKFVDLKDEGRNGSHDVTICDELNWDTSIEETDKAWFSGDEKSAKKLPNLEKVRDDVGQKDHSILGSNIPAHLNLKCKEIRKRSIYELTVEGQKSTTKTFPLKKVPKCTPEMKVQKISKNTEESSRVLHRIYSSKFMQEHRCLPISYSDAFCCVCGSSNQDDINCLLECSQCLIRVHQACYGISKVPKGRWYCRPCRTSSKDIVCVLCGYGGGAMTQALRSRTIVKGILKAWNIGTVCRHRRIYSAESLQNESNALHSSGSELERNFYPVLQPVNIKSSAIDVRKMEIKKQLDVRQDSLCCVSNLKVHNSITAGVLDSTVKQWVHMVCGLWTPGTRCPNVDTMTAFDVSGASRPKANVVCSICNRPGGSCIQCRVVNCCIQFHPWCAHQKGLLQSEVEGADNENVGFYGRCVLHAVCPITESSCDVINGEIGDHGENELTCARTEGYKGRKHDDPLCDLYGKSKGKGGCLVPQEQLNAWIHINTQKSTHGLPKLPNSDIEYDCRKEYARYKLAKGWKRLVVYKSGIHALGLYTSRFISRSEMVVEYVGEIVGLRVADKRENEYQSGRKLQYKSACYFFRIDKEHIIDATRKGGIARFVNHSCLPNCVAKVISVRNEKKVVFFAERDIFPGEEITYDYHFNHEDEGKKIPCFCSSKNCRRYLN